MTNYLAIWIGGLIVAFFSIDILLLGWDTHLVLMRLLIELIEYLAIWR